VAFLHFAQVSAQPQFREPFREGDLRLVLAIQFPSLILDALSHRTGTVEYTITLRAFDVVPEPNRFPTSRGHRVIVP